MFNFLLSFFSRWFKISQQFNDNVDIDSRTSYVNAISMGGSCRKTRRKKKNQEIRTTNETQKQTNGI